MNSNSVEEIQSLPVRERYYTCLVIAILAYWAVFGWLLYKTDGFPYVFDNNESFSSLWHARNLLNCDFTKSWGLTDESASPHSAAHPYVHTHQGNFPRIFAFLIYLLGANTIEAQIIVTTFTVGLFSFFLVYHFFAKVTNPLFALFVCLFLTTDYVYFVQWQVVTYRVWHGLFIFSSLLCVYYAKQGKGRWVALTFLNFLCLYYYELVFVIFTTVLCLSYACFLYWTDKKCFRRLAVVSGLGAFCSVAILLSQLVAYMGVEGTWNDIYYTVKARQFAEAGGKRAEEIYSFYQSHNIVFFLNFSDGRSFLNPAVFFPKTAYAHFGLFTAFLILPLLLLGGSFGFRMLFNNHLFARYAQVSDGVVNRYRWQRIVNNIISEAVLCGVIVMVIYRLIKTLFPIYALYQGEVVFSVDKNFSLMVTGLFLLIIRALVEFCFVGSQDERITPRVRKLIAAICLFVFGYQFLGSFNQMDLLQAELVGQTNWSIAILVAWVGSIVISVAILSHDVSSFSTLQIGRVASVYPICVCAFFGYFIASCILGGYVQSGYLDRWISFLSFFVTPFLALGSYVLLLVALDGGRAIIRSMKVSISGHSIKREISQTIRLSLAILVLVILGSGWLRLQSIFQYYMPANHYAGICQLAKEPFRGKTTICNSYALPPAWFTQEWSYANPDFAVAAPELTEDGYSYCAKTSNYLWLADRENEEYRRPEFYLFVRIQSVYSMLSRIHMRRILKVPDTFESTPSVSDFVATCASPLESKLEIADRNSARRWAMFRIDWDIPPYIKAWGDQNDSRVSVRSFSSNDGVRLELKYKFVHQEKKEETGTVVKVFQVHQDGSRSLILETSNADSILLPHYVDGPVQVCVFPATETKRGFGYWSDVVEIPLQSLPEFQTRNGNKTP